MSAASAPRPSSPSSLPASPTTSTHVPTCISSLGSSARAGPTRGCATCFLIGSSSRTRSSTSEKGRGTHARWGPVARVARPSEAVDRCTQAREQPFEHVETPAAARRIHQGAHEIVHLIELAHARLDHPGAAQIHSPPGSPQDRQECRNAGRSLKKNPPLLVIECPEPSPARHSATQPRPRAPVTCFPRPRSYRVKTLFAEGLRNKGLELVTSEADCGLRPCRSAIPADADHPFLPRRSPRTLCRWAGPISPATGSWSSPLSPYGSTHRPA